MTTHVDFIEDTTGDLVDIEYYCSASCFEIKTGQDSYGKAWPGGSETDYNVYCNHCGALLWEGLENEVG